MIASANWITRRRLRCFTSGEGGLPRDGDDDHRLSRVRVWINAPKSAPATLPAPTTLVGDLLDAFGWALWSGVVVVVLLPMIPEAKGRQYKRALDAYEAALREEAGARSDEHRPIDSRSSDQPTAEQRAGASKVKAAGWSLSGSASGVGDARAARTSPAPVPNQVPPPSTSGWCPSRLDTRGCAAA